MRFDLNDAIEAANQAVVGVHGRRLSDVEILVLKGAWERESYDQIAAQNQYSTSYISQDIAPKLWRLLSDATGEKIKKNSLKEPLKRYWEIHLQSGKKDPVAMAPAAPSSSPSSTAQPPQTTGSAAPELPFPTYIRWPDIEAVCIETLTHYPGSLLRIKAPKLTGKTSLINFVMSQLATQGMHTINLSLRMADRQRHFSNIDIFLQWFCCNVEQELGLESQIEQYWNAEWLGSKVSCTTYFEKYFLKQDDAPVILCIDDIDVLFAYPELYEDFFGLLRSWYEKARSRPQWKKLRLILAHSTEAYIRLNINQSPFNVGLPIELAEFTPNQAGALSQRLGLTLPPADIEALMALLGGHPYLLEKAFDHLRANRKITLTEFIDTAPTQAGIYRNHLQETWKQLKAHPALEMAFHEILKSEVAIAIEPTQAYQLQSMGLIKLMGNVTEVSCQLYRQYFLSNTPAADQQQQQDVAIEIDPVQRAREVSKITNSEHFKAISQARLGLDLDEFWRHHEE
jgi:hypothetical protein